ncbi:MAG: right-handed parallel beta-helix repeat-containing protein [Planctomycetaceae bacterium]
MLLGTAGRRFWNALRMRINGQMGQTVQPLAPGAGRFGFEQLEDRTLLSTITVTTASDVNVNGDGLISLREAIAIANSPGTTIDGISSADLHDTIVFASNLDADPIVISGAQININAPLTIQGNGLANTILDGANNSRIFFINYNSALGEVDLEGLTLRNGNAGSNLGGAVYVNVGRLSISDCLITDNQAYQGGGIYSYYGTLSIENSTIDNNRATYNSNSLGGGIATNSTAVSIENSTISHNQANWLGGGIYTVYGTAKLSNVTVSGNTSNLTSSPYGGGGMFNDGSCVATLRNCTFTGNVTQLGFYGGGLYSFNSGYVTTINSIFTGNDTAGSPVYEDLYGGLNGASHHNLFGQSYNFGGTNNLFNQAVGTVLDTTLANNGGTTLTHALIAGSTAINAGSNADALDTDGNVLTSDQRDDQFFYSRIIGGTVDIGAFEDQGGGRGDVHVVVKKGTANLSLADINALADIKVQFTDTGVTLYALNGTTLDGQTMVTLEGVTSLGGKLGNNTEKLLISGEANKITLDLNGGDNILRFDEFTGGATKIVSKIGTSLDFSALESQFSSLALATAKVGNDTFAFDHVTVSGKTSLKLNGGLDNVSIENSHFNSFAMQTTGANSILNIEQMIDDDGTDTFFDGKVSVKMGSNAEVHIGHGDPANETIFGNTVSFAAKGTPGTLFDLDATFAKAPKLKNFVLG